VRADAVRNREAVLRAAGRLFDEADDPEQVSMDDIAAEAGVGKGTLFRRFGDRATLVLAVHEERMAHTRESLTLDPGRTAAENIANLMSAVLRFKLENRALARALESLGSGSPYTNPDYAGWHARLTELIADERGPASADFLAHALLAAVRGDLVEHLADWPEARLHEGLTALVDSILG
jgi:AcrR family transcriptional regulator